MALEALTSPYLLQHADNSVGWWPWGPEAFEEAKRRDVPVLLPVGYSAWRWCQ
ncbi:thymidylate kinase [Streptomyces sp. CBMA291]|nr:thymidylate kinase [Streptomyces sp. CBMA291]MBD0713903.1 thymidylate kinase [Streptomyces sp. CBMA370]